MHNSPTSRAPAHNSCKRPGAGRSSPPSTRRQLGVPSPETSVSRRRRRPAALAASLALWLPLLAGAGWVADAATTASATPVLVSVTRTGPDAPAVTPPRSPTSAPQAAPSWTPRLPLADPAARSNRPSAYLVLPGPLSVSPTTESVSLTQFRAFGRGLPFYRGQLSPVTVVDARGSLVGWRASVSLQGVAGATAGQLAHARLCASATRPPWWRGTPATSSTGCCSRAQESVGTSRSSSPLPRGAAGRSATPPTSRSSSRAESAGAGDDVLAVSVH